MARAMVAVVVLLVWVPRASAAPVLQIQDPVFQGDRFWFDLALVDLGDIEGLGICGFEVGASLSGPGTAHLHSVAPTDMHRDGAEWAALIEATGGTFAWASFAGASLSANWSPSGLSDNFGPVNGTLLSFIIMDDFLRGTQPQAGDIVTRFIYAWDGVLPQEGFSVTICCEAASPHFPDILSTRPRFFGDRGSGWLIVEGMTWNSGLDLPQVEGLVRNNGMMIPEPATLGLAAAGLIALGARRRSSRARRRAQRPPAGERL